MPKPEIIKALLKAGADVNAKLGEEWSEKDTSALYRAVEGESLECVELIVAAGADLDYMNDRKVFTGLAKMTALQRAEDIGAKKIRDFLKSKGASAVSSSFRGRVDGVDASHRRQEGDEGEAAERRLTHQVVSTLYAHKVLRKRGERGQMGPTRAGGQSRTSGRPVTRSTGRLPQDLESTELPGQSPRT